MNYNRHNIKNTNSLKNNSLKNNKSNYSNYSKKIKDFTKIINYKIILLILLLIILIYIVILLIKYLTTKCYQKKSFFEYITNFSFNNVCKIKDLPQQQVINTKQLFDNKEVFHISNQDYNYYQAKCKCASYGGRLATYPEIVDAYNNGANWCTYGWSYGQNAYYPVQKCYFDKNKCGQKPGINGGFFPNPHLKFGVNCYGKKPKGQVVKPKPPICNENNNNVCNDTITKKLDTDVITPFNENNWNQ